MRKMFIIIRDFIIILVLLSQIVASSTCPILTCKGPNEGNDGDCFDYDKLVSDVSMFSKSCQNCQILLSQILQDDGAFSQQGLDKYNICSQQAGSFKKYSGEKCEQNNDCYSDKCSTDKVCQGLNQNDACDDSAHKYCYNGLSCINKKCQSVKLVGQECQTESECDKSSFCLNKKCVKYGSVQNGDTVGGNQQQIEVKCSSFLAGSEGKCIDNNTKLIVSSCPYKKKCTSDASFSCNIFSTDKLYAKQGGFTQKIHSQIQQLLEKILAQNTLCPNSLKFSADCHLISQEIIQLQEIRYIYKNLNAIVNMSTCLQDQLLHKQIYNLFVQESQIVESQIQDEKLNKNESSQDSEEDSKMFTILGVFAVLIIISIVGGYIYFKKRKFKKLNDSQSNSEASESSNGKRSSSNSKKDKSSNQSSMNKESLNLEYNPTSAKGDNQMDISNLQGQDPKKNGHLETSVNQNFFSIDGEDEKEVKIVDQLDDNQSESDSGVSYENVFNIEGDNVDKPNSSRKRRRQPQRKKIVKKDSEKKYEVVEE